MCVRSKFIGRLVHSHVAIQAKTQEADVYGAVGIQPAPDALALPVRVRRVATESYKASLADLQRREQLNLQIGKARGNMLPWQATPFIDLQHAHLPEQRRGSIVSLSKPPVKAGRSASSRGAEQQIRLFL